MKMTFRWFGENSDSVKLEQIKQIPGATGIMGFLDDEAAGNIWAEDKIASYIEKVHAAGLECEVIESVNVHEDIKLGLPSRDKYIENYCTTIRNLAKHGVKCIVYNFMPVLDWLRTDLARENPDGSSSMYYDEAELEGLSPTDLVGRTTGKSNGFSLPGWEPDRLADLEKILALYRNIDEEKLLENYKYFLDGIIPVCEECEVIMACHPDDPAWPVFGLPRIANSAKDFDRITALYDSPANAICLCTGSLGTNPKNDIPEMIRHFGKMGRIGCLHVRNLNHIGSDRVFRESSHFSSDGDLDMYEIMLAVYESCPDTYIRPDHGRMIWGEVGRPGYGLYDRALGACYLSGIWEAITKGSDKSR